MPGAPTPGVKTTPERQQFIAARRIVARSCRHRGRLKFTGRMRFLSFYFMWIGCIS
jgi:hypothetical protein